jgi:spore maturation protein CgeB
MILTALRWDKSPETRKYGRGHAEAGTLRKAFAGAKVALCLIRQANRDGHAMRSFELAAIGACMLVEDTEEHPGIFGEDGTAVVYFDTIPKMLDKLRWLLDHESKRKRLAAAVRRRIVEGPNTYRDRLAKLLRIDPRPLASSSPELLSP